MALNLPLDKKLSDSIHRRRIAEAERKNRIFNSKVRQIGIDVDALNWQVHDASLQRFKEEERERRFDEEALNNSKLATLSEKNRNDELREINKQIDEYRLNVQRPEYRRDFDLYDPDGKKKERPPRISDDDSCPVSSLQKLEGEDLSHNDRSKKQKEQARDLLLQQMQEKRLENYKRDKEEYEWEKSLLDQDHIANQLAKLEVENQRRATETLKKDNKIMSLQTVERNMREKIAEDIEKRKDIEYNFYGPLLREDPSAASGSDSWKGMSKDQLEEIYKGQLQQIEDNKRKREQADFEKVVWNKQLLNLQKEAQRLAEEEKKLQHQINKNLQSINRELSQEQKLHNEYMNKVAFRNTVSKEFYSQFNTTTR